MKGTTWSTVVDRRTVLKSAGALGASATLGGLSRLGGALSAKGRPRTGKSVTIVHWDYYVSQSPYIQDEIKRFEAAHKGITIKRTINASTTYDQLFSLAERSKKVPDTLMLPISTPPLNDQVSMGWLHPLDQWANQSWQHMFPPYSFVEGSNTFGGKTYTAPFSGNGAGLQLYVHAGVFKKYGLTNKDGSVKLPQTWDDVTRFARTITQKSGGAVYGIGFGQAASILSWWVDVFTRPAGSPGGMGGRDLRTGKYTYSSDRNYSDFISMLTEWRDKGYVYPNSMSIQDEVARAYFERGKFGMTVGGVWNQPEWTQHGFTDYELTTLIGPEPKRKGYFYRQPGGALWAMTSGTAHPDEAWEWLKWLYSPAAGQRWVQKYHEDLSTFPQDNNAKTIKFKPFAQYLALESLNLPGPQPWIRNKNEAFVIVNPVQPDINAVLSGIYTGQIKDVHSALSELDGRWTAALNQGIKEAQQKGYNVSINDYIFSDWDITKPYKWPIPRYLT